MGTEIQIQKVEHIQGWPLTVVRGEKQPLIEDEELGRKLGFDRPRRIRELIARIFNDSELCRTVRQSRGRSATVFYLTRSQALKVIMRSETPTADRVQDEIIAVYEAWLDGHLGPRKGTERLEYRTEFLKLLSDPVVVQQFRRLLSGPASKAELDGLAYVIEEAAEARHVSFNIVHGAIRKRLGVSTYRFLRSDQIPEAERVVNEFRGGPTEKDIQAEHQRKAVELVLNPRKYKRAMARVTKKS